MSIDAAKLLILSILWYSKSTSLPKLNYCCKQKTLEETETEETRGFFVAFLSFVTFQLGPGGGISGYTYVLGSLF